jgi:hypothetical protein
MPGFSSTSSAASAGSTTPPCGPSSPPRLGVAWGPVIDGHADIVGIPDELVAEFSLRSTQVDDKLRELLSVQSALYKDPP